MTSQGPGDQAVRGLATDDRYFDHSGVSQRPEGIVTFGGVNGGGGGDAPTIVYSRRIGLQGSTAGPIGFGGRLAGRIGRYNIGALNIWTEEVSLPKVVAANFTVVRVRRDVLQRSSIGALFTNRSASTVSPGSNQVFGVDANFGSDEHGGHERRTPQPLKV